MESQDYSFLEKVIMENNDSFDCLLITQGIIKNIPWQDPNYINQVLDLDYVKSITLNSDNFLDILAQNLKVDNFKVSNMSVKTEIVCEEPYYLYELIYIDLETEKQYHNDENVNEIANLICVNGDKVYSNAILFKNYIPSLTDSMKLSTVTKDDLKRVLYKRAYTTIVIGDSFENKFLEDSVMGDLEIYASKYFDKEPYKKIEISFLMHNINIWYTSGITENQICGNLVKEKCVDKCIWFTMKTDTYRDCLSLDQVTKIINLSLKLKDYKTPAIFLEEKTDDLNRKIIYNKYKVLDQLYNDHNYIISVLL